MIEKCDIRMKFFLFSCLCLPLLWLGGCASGYSPNLNRAPVEDRSVSKSAAPTIGPLAAAQGPVSSKPALGSENAGKPGYYTVKAGDTLTRIGLDSGQSWRDLARWNQLDRPSQIEVGQVLRVVPPAGAVVSQSVAVASPVPMPSSAATHTNLPTAVPVPAVPPTVTLLKSNPDDLIWIWPTNGGTVLAGFDESKNKGLDLSGKQGDSVMAAADGRVVYAGSGLRGYGNLVILKHNETFLSAYAHNHTILVKEDQVVTKGQKIAEMGQSDSDVVKLHFEIRKQGKPTDPVQYLPLR